MNAIEIKNLHKKYGDVTVLKEIHLEVKQGEIFGFLGPNGSGKTTTIRCLLDLIRPSKGEILVLGIDPQKNPVKIKEKVGYLPGELNLDETLTAKSCLKLFSSLRKEKIDWDFVKSLAERLQLNLDAKIKNFSKGNKQKVGIIQAFMHKPELIILDEPTSGLDPLMQKEVVNMVKEINNDGCTVFFSSHVLSEVDEISERVAIIRKGEIVDIASTQSLIAKDMRSVVIEFKTKVDVDVFQNVEGITQIRSLSPYKIEIHINQDLGNLIQTISSLEIKNFETVQPTLEDIFLTYYQK